MRKEADILDGCQKVILNTYMQHTKEGVTPEQINAMIDAETWKNGEEWQEFFDIEVSEKSNAAAYTSDYFERYNNLPKKLKGKPEPQETDIESLVDALEEWLKEKLKENQTLPAVEDKEKQIAAILEDLDLI